MKRILFYLLLVGLLVAMFTGCTQPATTTPSTTAALSPSQVTQPSQTATTPKATSPSPAPATPSKPVVLKAMSAFPTNTVSGEPCKEYMDIFNARAKEKGINIVMEYAGGPEAIAAADQMAALSRGVFDFLNCPGNYYENLLPEISSMRVLPRISPAEERQTGYYDYINKAHQNKVNSYYLGHADQFKNVYYTTKPVKVMADFKGLLLRVSPSYLQFTEALGAKAVVMPIPEVYSALERNVVDGVGLPDVAIVSFGFAGLVKYYIKTPYSIADATFCVNLDKWKSLTPDMQELLKSVALDYENDIPNRYNRLLAIEENELKKRGVTFVEFTGSEKEAWEKLSNQVQWDYVAKIVPNELSKLKELLKQ